MAIAFITGGSGAIGSAISTMLSKSHTVIVCGSNTDRTQRVVDGIIQQGKIAYPCVFDITNLKQLQDAWSDVCNKFKTIDILVNCVGKSSRSQCADLAEQNFEVINHILDLNIKSVLWCCKLASHKMTEQRRGNIVNIASIIGMCGKAKFVEYAAAKAGIIAATQSLAIELAAHNINVNCVSPGWITRQSHLSESEIQCIAKKARLKSIGYPTDVAHVVEFLTSDKARFITGQNFVIDGGRTLGLYGE